MDICHTWSFFEIWHGKGEQDGVGECVKRALRRDQMNHYASHLENSNDVVNWCKQNLSHEFNERMGNVRRFFQILQWAMLANQCHIIVLQS